VAILVRVPLGNGAPVSTYRLTVNGCPVPVPLVADSIPKETDVTSYSRPPVNSFMLNARQYWFSVVPNPLLHATELPVTISWLVDCVMVGGHCPGVGVGLGVPGVPDGVGVGDGGGGPPQTFSVSAVAVVATPSYPPEAIIRSLPIAAPDENDRKPFRSGESVQVSVAGS
jgi:hypothetical protein